MIDPTGGLTQYTRDSGGRVLTQTDALNRTTTFVRDGADFVTQETLPDGTMVCYAYQSSFHALTRSIDQNGNVTSFAYDVQDAV